VIPRGSTAPLGRPKGRVSRSVDLLKADHVGGVIAKETKHTRTFIRVGQPRDVQGEDLERDHRMRNPKTEVRRERAKRNEREPGDLRTWAVGAR